QHARLTLSSFLLVNAVVSVACNASKLNFLHFKIVSLNLSRRILCKACNAAVDLRRYFSAWLGGGFFNAIATSLFIIPLLIIFAFINECKARFDIAVIAEI